MRPRPLVAIGVALALGIAAASIRLPYLAVEPGRAIDVLPRIEVEGAVRDTAGAILSTDVVLRELDPLGLVRAWLDPYAVVVPTSTYVPPTSSFEEQGDVGLAQMASSKVDAAAAALRLVAGYPRNRGRGVLVEAVTAGCDAVGKLAPGDVVLAIDGATVRSVVAAGERIAAVPSGGTVAFRVLRDGGAGATVDVVREPCGGSTEPLVGVALVANLPVDVAIASGEVGGPSAGLAYALGICDLLTPGDLTGGRIVAATGAIGLRGRVRPVGGIPQKMRAAEEAGATVFLVPRGNLRDALAVETSMEVVPVRSLAEAVAALAGEPVG